MFVRDFTCPIENAIVYVTFFLEEVGEKLSEIVVVGGFEELELPHVAHVYGEFFGVALAEDLDRSVSLTVADLLVALLERVGFEALPGEGTAQEVHEHVADGFEVVSPGLLLAHVGVYAHVSGRSGQGLVLSVWYVLFRFRVDVFLRQAEVDDVDDGLFLRSGRADEEVFGLDVAVDDVSAVDVLDPLQDLIGDLQDGLQVELSLALREQLFQGGPEQLHHQGVIPAPVHSQMEHLRDPLRIAQHPVMPVLQRELRNFGLRRFHLDRHVLAVVQILAEPQLPEIPIPDFLANSVIWTNHENSAVCILPCCHHFV